MLKDLAKHQGLKGSGLALPPGVTMAEVQKAQEEQAARQEMMQLIHFRATCAMSNLNAMIGFDGYCVEEEEQALEASIAVSYAERLMVALKMIPNADFFRELEAMATEEANKPTEAPVSSGEEDKSKESGIVLP